jgi:hypothetical protein
MTGRLTAQVGQGFEIAGETIVSRTGGLLGADFANYGLMATQRYRMLELRSEVRHVRALGAALPSRTFVTASASRMFSLRSR